jgi:hypothetical protein
MTMYDMQTAFKRDSTGWEVYEICRHYGAFIVSGHAHQYARSYQIKRFATKHDNQHHRNIQVKYQELSTSARLITTSKNKKCECH